MTEPFPYPGITDRLDLPNLTRSEFISTISHLYRGELGEATAWRGRIDTTTNWAVVLSASSLSFVFSDKSADRQVLIPIVTIFCTFMMLMEARRYRFFDIWRTRARMIEINFYRPLLEGQEPAMRNWAEALVRDMEWPHFHMSWWEAVGRRLRRNYQWVYVVLLGSWLVVLSSHPTSTTSPRVMIDRAAIGPLSGPLVIAGMAVFYLALLALGLYSLYASRIRKDLPAGHPGRMSLGHNLEP